MMLAPRWLGVRSKRSLLLITSAIACFVLIQFLIYPSKSYGRPAWLEKMSASVFRPTDPTKNTEEEANQSTFVRPTNKHEFGTTKLPVLRPTNKSEFAPTKLSAVRPTNKPVSGTTKIPAVRPTNKPVSGTTKLPVAKGYLVKTSGCKIESVDPFNPSLKGIYRLPTRRLQCDTSPRYLSLKEGLLVVDPNLLRKWPNAKCQYTSIYRNFKEDSDNGFKSGSAIAIQLSATGTQRVADEFLQVSCTSGGSTIYTDFLTQVNVDNYERIGAEIKKAGLSDPLEKPATRQHKIDEKLNIIMLGIDSTSRLNSHRQLGNVRKYLLDQLGAFDLLGYNRVGDNTFQNVCPILMGKALFTQDIKNEYFDNRHFVWKSYQNAGYATFSAHDITNGAPFNYVKKGFSRSPVHHYYRPMSYAVKKSHWNKPHKYCCGRKPCYMWNIDYLKQYLEAYHKKGVPSFSFVFNVDVSHDDVNTLGLAQEDYMEFFRWYKEHSALRNNSVLVFFSDHGIRFGGMRQTYIGRYAENLPMMFVVFPEWFSRKYPQYASALRTNRNRLTTPYDLQQFLRDLCTDCSLFKIEKNYGVSLFEDVPEGRTCVDAGIPMHFCACREDKKLNTTAKKVEKAGQMVAQTLNGFMANKDVCAVLSLSKIVDAYETVHSSNFSKVCYKDASRSCPDSSWKNMANKPEIYTLTVETQPGGGQFQATVGKQGDKYSVIGDVSRINRYGNASSCITDDFFLSKLCYCKSNIRT